MRKGITLMAIALLALFSCKPEELDMNETTRLTVWSYFPSFEQLFIEPYLEEHPEIEFEFLHIAVGRQAFDSELTKAMRKGIGAPDIVVSPLNLVKKNIYLDYWENISADFYMGEQVSSEQIDYIRDFARDEEGNLRALSWQAVPSGMIYRRDVATKVLGNDDPDQVSKYTGDWNKYLELGRRIYKESEGEVTLTSTFRDLASVKLLSKTTPWIIEGEIKLDKELRDLIANSLKYQEEGLYRPGRPWGGDWLSGLDNGKVFSYFNHRGFMRGTLENKFGKNSMGEWGLAQPPEYFNTGGAWLGLSQISLHKEEAWDFIKYIIELEDFELSDQLPSNMEMINAKASQGSNPYFAGQNDIEYFRDLVSGIDLSSSGIYDSFFELAYWETSDLFIAGRIGEDEIEETFYEIAYRLIPEL